MKKFFKYILILVFATMIVLTLVACKKAPEDGWVTTQEVAKNLDFEGFEFDETKNTFSLKVSNDTESLSLSNLASRKSNASWKLYNNAQGIDNTVLELWEEKTKTVELEVGNNVFYAISYEDGVSTTYTIEIWRDRVYEVYFREGDGYQGKTLEVADGDILNVDEVKRTLEGYNFLGWTPHRPNWTGPLKDEEGNYISFDFSKPITKERMEKLKEDYPSFSDIALYMRPNWKPKEFVVTLDCNGGTFAPDTETTLNVTYSKAFELPDNMTLDGYTFDGWYYDGKKIRVDVPRWKNNEYVEVDNPIWQLDLDESEITLVAKWFANQTEVTFDVNGGNGEYAKMLINKDDSITLPVPTHSDANYKFLGWFAGKTDGDRVTNADAKVTKWECEDKNIILYARWITSEEASATYQRVDANGKLKADGNYILFGEYPQTIKADNVNITNTQDSRGYYLGDDGFYYAKIVCSPYTYLYQEFDVPPEHRFSNGKTVEKMRIYYFKVEPIRWKILSESDGRVTILCDSIIDNRRFGPKYPSLDDWAMSEADEQRASNKYALSEIRAWLNYDFYNTAFSTLQRDLIEFSELENKDTNYPPYIDENTVDLVFLPSYDELNALSDDVARERRSSDYTKANGIRTDIKNTQYNHEKNVGYAPYWTRTRGSAEYRVYAVSPFGVLKSESHFGEVRQIYYGVVPMLNISLL